MLNALPRQYKRHFQIGGLVAVAIILLAGKSCFSDRISDLAYRSGIGAKSRDPNKGEKGSAGSAKHGNAISRGHMPPSYTSNPGSIAREYFESNHYVITGTVTSEKGDPLSGATVFVPSRWWDKRLGLVNQAYSLDPNPLVMQTCDANGRYRMVLDAPFKGVLVAEKNGFATKFSEIEMQFAGVLTQNYQLRTAAACVEGSVSDQNGAPLPRVDIYAETTIARGDNSIPPPSTGKSDSIGRYRINGLPAGNGLVFAIAEKHFSGSSGLTFADGECARCDFVLKDAVDMRLKIKNRKGEAIAYASACGKTLSNEKGEVRLPLPVGTLPFDCATSAPGYREKHVTVDPENGVSTIILDEGGPAIEGRVVSESGLPVEDAKVSIEGLGEVHSDKSGRYRIPLRHGGQTVITAYKAGYVESRQSLNVRGEGSADNIIVLSSATGGIYGYVARPDGSPVLGFGIELIAAGEPTYPYDRVFNNPNGMFYINDVPAARYSFRVVPTGQADAGKFFSFEIPAIEIKKDYFYGEIYIQLQAR